MRTIPPAAPKCNLSKTSSRRAEYSSAALRLLDYLRQAARDGIAPSTAELQDERVFGLRPVNRLGDLIRGKFNRTRYDIERLDCGHGVYRWRLHEPARPGCPKHKAQTVLPLTPPVDMDWQHRPRVATDNRGRPLDASGFPLFAQPGVR